MKGSFYAKLARIRTKTQAAVSVLGLQRSFSLCAHCAAVSCLPTRHLCAISHRRFQFCPVSLTRSSHPHLPRGSPTRPIFSTQLRAHLSSQSGSSSRCDNADPPCISPWTHHSHPVPDSKSASGAACTPAGGVSSQKTPIGYAVTFPYVHF